MTTNDNDNETKPVPYYLRPNQLQKEMNATMAEIIPELDSEYARTPMARSRWREPSEALDDGSPCFIAADKEDGKRQDYIWMPRKKDLPAGYYHLATQEAYIQANILLRKLRPNRLCCRHKNKLSMGMYRKLKNLLYNRVITDVPDDVHAQRIKLLSIKSAGGQASAFGKAAYLPTLTSVLLLGLGGHQQVSQSDTLFLDKCLVAQIVFKK